MNYLSVCSGIEAATCAWHHMGWKPVALSEIEKFPSAVLAHHYPDIPNLGDMTKFHEWPELSINLLVGGTPCQAFSVAGLREGLADPRGNLTLTFLGVADKYRPEWVVWENVPGVLSDRTNAFGQFLAGLGQLGYGFAYRMLDAQYFGLAQRRKRVFVVGCLGGWERAAAVLFEPESLRGNPPPSREARKGVAPCLAARTKGGGGLRTDFDCDGGLVGALACNTGPRGHDAGNFASNQGVDAGYVIPIQETAGTLRCHTGGGGWPDPIRNETLVAHSTSGAGYWVEGINALRAREQESHEHLVAHSLRAEGFDASEDGTGRGTPLVPIISPALKARDGKGPSSDGDGDGAPLIPIAFNHNTQASQLPSPTRDTGINHGLTCSQGAAVCFTDMRGDDRGSGIQVTGDQANTLHCAKGPSEQQAVAFAQNSRDEVRKMPYVGALAAEAGMRQTSFIRQSMQVRRLTPTECEKLQGFPVNYTAIPWRGKPADKCPDGPRYKALGNSMAVPCMRWIGERIQMVINQPEGMCLD